MKDNSPIETTPTALAQHKKLRFWLLQLCGWLPFYLLQLPIFGDDNWLSVGSVMNATSVTALAVLGSLLLRRMFNGLNNKVTRSDLWILAIIFSGFSIAFMVDLLHNGLWYVVSLAFEPFSMLYKSQPVMVITGFLWLTYIFWGSLYLALSKQEKLNAAMINQQKLALLVKENKINRLLEQLNPHFMFNTINNIRALILKDTEQARDMLTSFADIMRYQINSNNETLVTLAEELAFVLEYIELNRLQLGKRLQFVQEIDPALLNHSIPRMALQLLVENAIKHGFSRTAEPGILTISINYEATEKAPKAWFISVTNSGELVDANKSDSGIGLINLRERLKLSFANNYQLTLSEDNGIVDCKIQFTH